ncbi:MAG: hypothetical protein RQ842_06675 [Vulcanisaeta sp.]|nr:hypothetical protein [Vulcanisaeta sp.]
METNTNHKNQEQKHVPRKPRNEEEKTLKPQTKTNPADDFKGILKGYKFLAVSPTTIIIVVDFNRILKVAALRARALSTVIVC